MLQFHCHPHIQLKAERQLSCTSLNDDTEHQSKRSQRKRPSPHTSGETQQDSGYYPSTVHEIRSGDHEVSWALLQ